MLSECDFTGRRRPRIVGSRGPRRHIDECMEPGACCKRAVHGFKWYTQLPLLIIAGIHAVRVLSHLHSNLLNLLWPFSNGPASRRSSPIMMSRCLRFLVSILVAAAILAPPLPFSAALGTTLPCHPSNHLPRKQQRLPGVVKTRTALAIAARSASTRGSQPKPRPTNRRLALSSSSLAANPPSAFACLHRIFRPLRC